MTRCQVCGRRQGTNKGGMIRHHHVRGDACLGAGYPPVEQDDARLVEAAAAAAAEDKALSREYAALLEARANWIDPTLISRAAAAASLSLRLDRRLARHRAWPQRFTRQMETQGWGDPPPAYLIERARCHDGN